MRKASFRWYLKKRLMEATDTKTLNIRKLEKAAENDEILRAALVLYISANLSMEDAKRRLGESFLLADYGKYYYENGYPGRDAIRAMPDNYHEIYDGYIRYISGQRTDVRIKTKCRQELLNQMEEQGLSRRAVGKKCGVDFACVSRFLQGGDYALGAERLKSILDTLREEKDIMTDSLIRINDYREQELAKGMMEVSFTLNIAEEALAALRNLCRDNDISFADLMERFFNWLIVDMESARQWIQG